MKSRTTHRLLILGLSSLTALISLAACADFSAEPSTFGAQPSLVPADLAPTDPDEVSTSSSPSESSPATGESSSAEEEDPCRPSDPSILAACLDAPWGLAVLPDGMSALVGERTTGRILQVAPATEPVEVLTVPDLDSSGDGGLLGIALSPAYSEDGLIYVYATTATDNRILRIARGDVPKAIFTGIPKGATHNGGRITFGNDGYLYIATGDAGDPSAAADPESLSGKVLRLDEFGNPVSGDGSAPGAAPTSGEPSATPPTGAEPTASEPPGTEPTPTMPTVTVPTRPQNTTSPSTTTTATTPTPTDDAGTSNSESGASPEPGDATAIYASGLTNPTGICVLETGELSVIDRDGANDVLIPVANGADLTQTARLWSYPVIDGGANDCAAGAGTVAATSLDGQKVTSLSVGVGGAFTGQPEILVEKTYGRLLSLTTAADGLLIATTSNKDGFGEPKPRDDMVVVFLGGGGGGSEGPD